MRWRSRRSPVLPWEETDLESKSFPRKMKNNSRAHPGAPQCRPFPHRGRLWFPSGFPFLAAFPAVPIAIPVSRRPPAQLPSMTRRYGNRKALGFHSLEVFRGFDCFDGDEPQTGSSCFGFRCSVCVFALGAVCGICMGIGKRNRLQTANHAASIPCAEDPSVSREGELPTCEGT